jgi:hypothetical protein
MKRKLLTINFLALLALVAVLMPQSAFAEGIIEGFAQSGINSVIAYFANFLLSTASWFVTVTGVFLSISINLTMHIKDIYSSVPAIETVWVVVRDLSSMFIIFILLFSAITMILGVEIQGFKFSKLIVSVFIAGILINFSLFFVKLAIDASNLVSLQFYNAIAPQTATNFQTNAAFFDGGLSDIFMQSLRLPKIYENTSVLKSVDVASSIGLAALGGVVMMIVAGLSFLGAAVAFTLRTGILLFCMALSPLFFVGMIFPKVKEVVSKKLFSLLQGQLLFMPAYLFLMYIALRVISDDGFMKIFNQSAVGGTTAAASSAFGPALIGTIVQYVIALVFINVPLVAAITLGAEGASWVPGSSNYNAVNKWIGSKLGGVAGRNTLGRVSRGLGESFDNLAASNFAQNTKVGKFASGALRTLHVSQGIRSGLKAGEESKYGSAYSLGDIKKEDKARTKDIRKLTLKKELQDAVEANRTADIKRIIGQMSDTEIANLDTKTLKNQNVVPHLSSNVYKNIEKGEKEDKDKVEISEARTRALESAVQSNQPDKVKDIMRNMSGEDLEKMLQTVPVGAVVSPMIVANLKPNQLKNMENANDIARQQIGASILNWHNVQQFPANGGRHHPAFDYVNNNRHLWG